jgi:hypothetical protein
MAEETATAKRRKGRSPAYPGLDLEAALEKARQLYANENHHPASIETILDHWGHAAKSGAGLVAVAALKKFGLLEDAGKGDARKAKLTSRALDIIHDERNDSADRRAAIRAAALEPVIHRELWDAYDGKLPSDKNLRFHLIRERGFTENGADDLIRELRATFSFARLTESDSMSEIDGDKTPGGGLSEDGMSAAAAPVTGDQTQAEARDFQFTVTLYGGRLATIKAPIPMTKRNLERLKRMIEDQLEPFVDAEDPEA